MVAWFKVPELGRAVNRFILVVALALGSAGAAVAGDCGDIGRSLRGNEAGLDNKAVQAFYDSFGSGCAWDEKAGAALIAVLQGAEDHGLEPALFHADAMAMRDDAARDILMTDGALKYASVMTYGLSGNPPAAQDRAHSKSKGEFVDGLIDALIQGEVTAWLDALPPKTDTYERLRAALTTYRAIAQAGGWEPVPDSVAGKWRRKSKDYSGLRRRLAMEGDLAADNGSARYDDELWNAVVEFQERNSLRADGRLTPKTIERLNISASQRVAQIALNLDRLRVAERDTPATRVEVNAPAATAVLFRDGAPFLRMNAVVGAPDGHETPTLTSTIDTVILNPTWTIPQSIIEKEIKPALKRNKKYLEQNRMYWVRDQLVQEAGPHNALGRIKFDFPNRYSVYLHDTPSRRAFTDPERAQSHGCVRLEKPLDLAVELLKADPAWDRNAIEDVIREGATRRIALSEPMPVVITYQTAFVAEDGATHFRPDIYGRDTQLTLVLSERAATMRSEPPQW